MVAMPAKKKHAYFSRTTGKEEDFTTGVDDFFLFVLEDCRVLDSNSSFEKKKFIKLVFNPN